MGRVIERPVGRLPEPAGLTVGAPPRRERAPAPDPERPYWVTCARVFGYGFAGVLGALLAFGVLSVLLVVALALLLGGFGGGGGGVD